MQPWIRAALATGLASLIAWIGAGQTSLNAGTQSTPADERVVVSDNRHPAGALRDGMLTIRLEARRGRWQPDGDRGTSVTVKAFAADGGALQVPGPLLRVPAGTTVRVVLSNRAGDDPLAVHGLYSRPAAAAATPMVIPAGETREVQFTLATAGTFYYWAAAAPSTTLQLREPADTQLSGAIIVDPPGPPADDRVLVIGYWHNGVAAVAGGVAHERYRYVINGRSWPATERLEAHTGQPVRLRIVNAGANTHPMHLHGFYFDVTSRGDEQAEDPWPANLPAPQVVTERMTPGRTFSLRWTPSRPGNWLFHCHDNVHLDHGGALGDSTPGETAPHDHGDNHALSMMAGPVVGITVSGDRTEAAEPSGPRRTIRLTARVDRGGTDTEPAYGYTIDDGRAGRAPEPPYLPGPTLLLKRGEPVTIRVENRLPEPTAVHWHGIELESYYDGVAGYAGQGAQVAPAIPPGGSFDARFTPPRSGTFIYHTHLDDTRQQRAGLSGPLLVVDDPGAYDPEHDLVFLVTTPRRVADNATVLVNGSATPGPRTFRAGERYRFRFINAHTFRPGMRMRVLKGDAVLEWRAVAKDGMDLPQARRVVGPSEVQMGNGETYDFEFVPDGSGDVRLDVTTGGGVLLATVPLPIRSR